MRSLGSGAEAVVGNGIVTNRDHAERYFELLKDAKVKGYLFAQQNYVDEPFKR